MHDGEKPFICYCGASFTLKGNLKRHQRDKQCRPTGGKDPNSSSNEEEAAKILNEMSSRKSKAESEAEGSPTPKKKRKSVPRKTMSQDSVNDVDEEVAAAWQLMKDSILEEEDDDDEEDEDEEEEEEEEDDDEEEDEEAQDDGEEADQKPNYAELMAMFPEHGAEIEEDDMTTSSSNAQSMFQCLDSTDPAFQFPVDSRAVEVTTFLNPYSSSDLDQTGLKYHSDTTDPSTVSAGLVAKFQTQDPISASKDEARAPPPPDVVETTPNQSGTASLNKVLRSDASAVCAVPVEALIDSTFDRAVTSKSDGSRRNEGASNANRISSESNDSLEKTISDINEDDDGYSADDRQLTSADSDFSLLRPKAARLGKKASLAALFGAKLVPEHEQT